MSLKPVLFVVALLAPVGAWCGWALGSRGRTDVALLAKNDENGLLVNHPRPLIAVITEPNACESNQSLERTFLALENATSRCQVDLVSIRITRPTDSTALGLVEQRVQNLTRRLLQLSSQNGFSVVLSSDWVRVAVTCQAHGVHVKETHRDAILSIRQQAARPFLIGTSAHSVESALSALEHHQPDYLFVGTCYVTQTHPEKTAADLEGPALPGQVVSALKDKIKLQQQPERPAVLAIGGIGPSNCAEPVLLGADGVATIRSVLRAQNPSEAVAEMKQTMSEVADKSAPTN